MEILMATVENVANTTTIGQLGCRGEAWSMNIPQEMTQALLVETLEDIWNEQVDYYINTFPDFSTCAFKLIYAIIKRSRP